MRQCKKCQENKSLEEFYKSSPNVCKPCKREYNKEWKEENKSRQKENLRRNSLKRRYGITPEQYNQLLKEQDNKCAICDRPQSAFSKNLAVDHDHHTGEIRGLLCSYCNHRLLGRLRDSSLLRKMADYLDKGTGWFVPKKKRTVKRKRKIKK